MASWDSTSDWNRGQAGLRCLACGNPLDERLAVLGSLRCLDCRAASAVLDQRLIAAPGLPPAAETTQEQAPGNL